MNGLYVFNFFYGWSLTNTILHRHQHRSLPTTITIHFQPKSNGRFIITLKDPFIFYKITFRWFTDGFTIGESILMYYPVHLNTFRWFTSIENKSFLHTNFWCSTNTPNTPSFLANLHSNIFFVSTIEEIPLIFTKSRLSYKHIAKKTQNRKFRNPNHTKTEIHK